MLGHCAQSVGGALPGLGAASAPVTQVLLNGAGRSVAVPADYTHVFAEAVGRGGSGSITSTGNRSSGGGAAGSDAIFAVSAGSDITVAMDSANAGATTISYGGSTMVTASNGGFVANGAGAGAGGKYNGQNAASSTQGGSSGGRLGGQSTGSPASGAGGNGNPTSSPQSGTIVFPGGASLVVLTFFRMREDAVAFANSLYGGNWQP